MIRGIVSAVPFNTITNADDAFVKMTGVRQRRMCGPTQDVVTLAEDATMQLISKLGWDLTDLSALVFVTQTPTVRMPAMACALAGRIGYKGAAFDINLACSGYPYGLWVASKIKGRVLLVAGDTVSRMTAENDKLFGDCVTATAVESKQRAIINSVLGTDGYGFDKLIADPVIRMDGPAVTNFVLNAVPRLVHVTTLNAGMDWYFFHQANALLLRSIIKKCRLEEDKTPINIDRFGNTSSASIPLLMCASEATEHLMARRNRVALFGFGAGWSWGGLTLDLEPLQVCEVIES